MDNGFFVFSSFKAGSTNIIPIETSIDVTKVTTLKGEVVIYSDNYKDFIAVASNDFIWLSQSAASTAKSQQLTKAITNATLQAEILTVFSQAQYVSFEKGNALAISKPKTSKFGTFTIVNFDGTTFAIKDQLTNSMSFKKGQFKDLENPSAAANY